MKKILYVIFSFIVVILGFVVGSKFFGLLGGTVGALLAASYVGRRLLQNNVISSDSVLVKETKGIAIAKYVVLALVLSAIFGAGAYMLFSN